MLQAHKCKLRRLKILIPNNNNLSRQHRIKMGYKMLRQAFFAITCSYQIMNSVTIVAAITVAATF